MTATYLSEEAVAAELGVSPTYLRGLLDSGRLPFVETESGRRITRADLKTFLKMEQEEAHAALDALAENARHLGLR